MFRAASRRADVAAALAALVAVCALPIAAAADPAGLYPTDTCVANKLRASADYCWEAVQAFGRGDPSQTADDQLLRARARLESNWAKAEAKSLAAGVACDETTATSSEMISTLDAGASVIGTAIARSEAATDAAEQKCEARRTTAASQACHLLLWADAKHLLSRNTDRDRSQLESTRTRLDTQLAMLWNTGPANGCGGTLTGAEAVAAVGDAVESARGSLLVSPRVSSEWTMVTPDGEVPYQGKTLEPTCSGGTPWVFFVKRGSVNKTLMYYQGGGACWDYVSCRLPTHKTTTGPNDNPSRATTGFANFSNPDNPFRDWNAVFVPYCTGDVHWGDATVEYTLGRQSVTIQHKGYVNAQVAEKWAREHFVNPDAVFVTGSSAGSYGAIVNSLPLQENVWPSSHFDVLGDAGNGVITQRFLENDIARWGVEQNLPDWIPALNRPLVELTAADLWTASSLYYPRNRFANYSSAFDGGQGGQTGFYNTMLNPGNPIAWVSWWVPSCEWNAQMRALVQDSASQAPNYRYYIGSGSRHTMWGNNKVYTDTTGGVPTIVSWIRAMLGGTVDWTNVETTDPGLLLPGDPRPNPSALPPYTDDGRVVCED